MAIFSMILSLLCGVALFLFGMSLMGDGLKMVAGNKLEALLISNDKYTVERSSSWYGCYQCDSVIIRHDGYGHRFCKLRYDEAEAGDRYHHGCQHRNQYYRLDPVSFLYWRKRWRNRQVSLSTATISAVVAVIGIIFRMFCKRSVHKNIGNIMLGFAILMTGMQTMSGAVSPLRESPSIYQVC